MTDWADEKAREIIHACPDPDSDEVERLVSAALREADKRAREECRHDYDGLEADLAAALDVLWRRGGVAGRDFIRRNYPGFDPERPFETIRSATKD